MIKLTGFQLKLIAAFLMLIDHIYQFIPGTPIVFTYFGRLVAPVFIFLAVEGFHYTRNRYEYIGRLLGFGVIMHIGSRLMLMWIPSSQGIPNNIFLSIGLSIAFLQFVEYYQVEKRFKWNSLLAIAILVALAKTEGSYMVLWLVILFYKYRGNTIAINSSMVIISAVFGFLMLDTSKPVSEMLLYNYQWMMVFSLVLINLYNGKRGRGWKYFFYIYYPLHIWVLYYLGVTRFGYM